MYIRIHPCADVPPGPDVDDGFMTAPAVAKQDVDGVAEHAHAAEAGIDELPVAAASYVHTTIASRHERRKGARVMTIKKHATTDRTYERAVAAKIDAARALYSAEIAVHDAHQTHVDQWISAANDRLHIAVAQYLAATALVAALCPPPLAA
jgi:hypothetical protein